MGEAELEYCTERINGISLRCYNKSDVYDIIAEGSFFKLYRLKRILKYDIMIDPVFINKNHLMLYCNTFKEYSMNQLWFVKRVILPRI